jgi:hypothetical protein
VASTTDGGASWATVDLPDDVARLEQAYPGKISISQPSIAAQDDDHQVAVVNVSTNVTPSLYRSDIPEDSSWGQVPGGIELYEASEPCTIDGPSGDAPGADPANVTEADTDALARRAIEARGACESKAEAPTVLATYTWDELGVPAELQHYIGGRTLAYAADDGQHFERVSLPGDPAGWGASVLATDDGYRLLSSQTSPTSSSTTVLRSADGHTWVADSTLDGSLSGAGLLGDRPAVSVWTTDGHGTVEVQQADGSWSGLDLLSAIDAPAGQELWLGDVAFGPLGLAATVFSNAKGGDGPGHTYLVHSATGATLSVLDLADYFDGATGGTMGLAVSADAITVRAVHAPDGDPRTVEPTDVLVGTPR